MGGSVSLGIFREEQKVLARLMESQIWHLPAGSVAFLGRGLRRGTMASAHVSVWEKAVPQLLPDARHFSSSLYATGAF